MELQAINIGDFVVLDGLVGVVVGVGVDAITPEDHLAIWFGEEGQQRVSQGGAGAVTPEVFTVPSAYVELLGKSPKITH